jgi:putative FmdB family regulatory protein
MPVYEFRCRTCEDVFELSRPMAQASDPATCPSGHEGAVKLLSRVMVLGRTAGETDATGAAGAAPMGGCCGGGCGCH